MILKTKNGQALVETLFALKVIIASVSLMLIGLHGLSSYYLTDHLTYEAAICLAKENSPATCKLQFFTTAKLLPYAQFQILELSRSHNQVRVITQLSTPLNKGKLFKETLSLPLTSQHFGASQ